MGSRAHGGDCFDINECLEGFPCLNGGTCKNLEDERMFMCSCPRNYSGMVCELEVMPAGILTTSTDFIIALVVCILVLLSKSLSQLQHYHIVKSYSPKIIYFQPLAREKLIFKFCMNTSPHKWTKTTFCMFHFVFRKCPNLKLFFFKSW